jgi:hypothetical protein
MITMNMMMLMMTYIHIIDKKSLYKLPSSDSTNNKASSLTFVTKTTVKTKEITSQLQQTPITTNNCKFLNFKTKHHYKHNILKKPLQLTQIILRFNKS